jgi:sugar (pentulose or hexulose) kinase
MPLILGLDLGTTTVTALALDTDSGEIVARQTVANSAEITIPDDKARGRSEWDAGQIAAAAFAAIRAVAKSLGARRHEVAGIGLTGQQHGVVLVDEQHEPLTPLVNWQDRRAEEINPHTGKTWLDEVRALAGSEARRRTGCSLSAGYMGITLHWLKENGRLPGSATACFIVDYAASVMTGERPVTDATSAASSGLFDVCASAWHQPLIDALGLPTKLFPPLHPAGEPCGYLTVTAARETGLAKGVPVCVGLGDNQASFFGSVAELDDTILVNVGTGGQVAAFSDRFVYASNLETRPFPGGYLLVSAGLCGGRTYALLERFFRQVVQMTADNLPVFTLYDAMNRLADVVPRGADGLRCEPLFSGTRQNPQLRGAFSGISTENFTPAHVTRAMLEAMANKFQRGRREIEAVLGKPRRRLVGAGNGLRENPVLARIVSEEFGMPLAVPAHREEAAFGAALLAAGGLGIIADRHAVARLIRY